MARLYSHVLREQYIGSQGPSRPANSAEGLTARAAIKAFNQRHLNDPIGKHQPLLTEWEVIAAISRVGKPNATNCP